MTYNDFKEMVIRQGWLEVEPQLFINQQGMPVRVACKDDIVTDAAVQVVWVSYDFSYD
jgi:hypothetical protein